MSQIVKMGIRDCWQRAAAFLFGSLVVASLLAAAPRSKVLSRPLVFEPNHGQAPSAFRWIGEDQLLHQG